MAEFTLAAVAGAIAMKFVNGIVDIITDKLMEALGLDEETIDEKLVKTIHLLADVIGEELDEQWHDECLADLASLTFRVTEWHNSTREIAPNWWAQKWAIEDLDDMKRQSSDVIFALKRMDLLGWEVFFLAVSLRLRILATLNQMPDRTEKENIDNLIAMSIEHHRSMCWKLRNKVVLITVDNWHKPNGWNKYCLEVLGYVLDLYHIAPHVFPDTGSYLSGFENPGYALPIMGSDLLGLMRELGVSDSDWLSRMPPVSGIANDDWHADLPTDEYWFWTASRAIYKINTEVEREKFKQTLYERKSAIEFWIWSHYAERFTAPLHEVTFEWLRNSGLVKEIKHIAIRASFGTYVTPVTSPKVHDWEPRGQLQARKDELEPGGIFRLISWTDGSISLYASNQQYVAADQYSDLAGTQIQGELVANKDWVGEWERFRLRYLGPGKVAFLAGNGRYVRVDVPANARMIADLENIDEQLSAFEIVELGQRKLKRLSLKCIKPQDSDGVDLCDMYVIVDGQPKLLGSRKKFRQGNVWDIPVDYAFYVKINISVSRFSEGIFGFISLIPKMLGSITMDDKTQIGANTIRFSDRENTYEYELAFEIGES